MTKVIADLHLHSKYSRAVSQEMVPGTIAKWCARKGINLVGTADFTHPLWVRELQANLEEAGEGVYRLRTTDYSVDFILSSELSCIYSQGGKGRRIHIIVLAPSFETVEKINSELKRYGVNLLSDGRPIMGLSAQNLAQIILGTDPRCLLIPAHAWTPYFSLYGSISGFDSIDECFGEYSKYIYAIETGLSSDPAMNWRIEELENRSIVSFSDAHSPAKLGRETTVFDLPEVSFEAIRQATQQSKIAYTIEFYPEEGKYHFTGHRNCGVKQTPGETRKNGAICPVCGRRLTVGVMHRVEQLASIESRIETENDEYGVKWIKHPGGRPPYVMMVPLLEILAEAMESIVSSQKVHDEYGKLTNNFGGEFKVLLQTKGEDIERISGPRLSEAIEKVRRGDIFIDPGYDGEFGKVKIWKDEGETEQVRPHDTQMGLF